jgi:hypothetical protein
VILPLVRPELFDRGKLLKPTKARRAPRTATPRAAAAAAAAR